MVLDKEKLMEMFMGKEQDLNATSFYREDDVEDDYDEPEYEEMESASDINEDDETTPEYPNRDDEAFEREKEQLQRDYPYDDFSKLRPGDDLEYARGEAALQRDYRLYF